MPKDPKTGKFVAKKKTQEELLAELAALDETEPEIVPEFPREVLADTMPPEGKQFMTSSTEVVEDAPKPRESLVLQSKYHEHTISIVPTRRVYHPISGTIEPIPGLFAQFQGPQRIFDSLREQAKWGWTDEQLDTIERKLVSLPEYMKDFYPAPLRPLPEHLKEFARVKEPEKVKHCMAFGYNEGGDLVQCDQLATAGRQWCYEHDPSTVKITTGGGTTVG